MCAHCIASRFVYIMVKRKYQLHKIDNVTGTTEGDILYKDRALNLASRAEKLSYKSIYPLPR